VLLRLENVNTYYGQIHILQGVSMEVHEGELVCLLGGNASGKSTTLKTILGIVRPRSGRVIFADDDVTNRPTNYRISKGMAIVPENRRLFAPMTVQENLEMGAYLNHSEARDGLDRAYELFPLLKERRRQLAGTLSGGEQQMVAIGRALMARPSIVLLDEPSLGLAPMLVKEIFTLIQDINHRAVTVLLVEQNARQALRIANQAYVLEKGRVTLAGPAERLMRDPHVVEAYLGEA